MGIKYYKLVWKHSEQSGSHKLTMLALAEFADDNGECWPSHDTIAKMVGTSTRQVRNILAALEKAGEIEIMSGRGRNHTNTYRIMLSENRKSSVENRNSTSYLSDDKIGNPARKIGNLASQNRKPTSYDPVEPSIDPSVVEEAATASDPEPRRIDQTVGKAWADNMPGVMTPILADRLMQLEEEYSTREIVEAISVAVKRNKRNLGYVEGVLRRGVDLPTINGSKPKTAAYFIDPTTGERKEVMI